MHRTLPRVLEQLSNREPTNMKAKAIEALMESAGVWHDNNLDDTDQQGHQNWEELLEMQESKEMSFAEVNAKRKQLTFQFFSDPKVPSRILILESMVGPNLQLMDRLFKRSGWISSLYHLPKSANTRRDELKERRERVKPVES